LTQVVGRFDLAVGSLGPLWDSPGFAYAPLCNRRPQVRDAGLEIVFETGERGRQEIGVVGAHAARQLAGDGA